VYVSIKFIRAIRVIRAKNTLRHTLFLWCHDALWGIKTCVIQ